MISTGQQDLKSALQNLLDGEFATLRALNDALENEYRALIGNDVEALELATKQKTAALSAHRTQQMQRVSWLQAQSLDHPREQSSGNNPGASPLAQLIDSDPALTALETTLATLAEACHDSNRRNGGLILRLQDRTRNALDVLRGGDSGGDLYSLSGARQHKADGRSLGKA